MKRTTTLLIFSLIMIITLNAQAKKDKYIDILERASVAYIDADLNSISELFHKDYKYYMFGTYEMGYDDLINRIKAKKGGGEKVVFHDWVVEGDKVACTWTAHFKDAVFKGMKLYVMKDDKIIEEWAYYKMVDE